MGSAFLSETISKDTRSIDHNLGSYACRKHWRLRMTKRPTAPSNNQVEGSGRWSRHGLQGFQNWLVNRD
jgi:hypothetical protein